jgi:hypothetical protein
MRSMLQTGSSWRFEALGIHVTILGHTRYDDGLLRYRVAGDPEVHAIDWMPSSGQYRALHGIAAREVEQHGETARYLSAEFTARGATRRTVVAVEGEASGSTHGPGPIDETEYARGGSAKTLLRIDSVGEADWYLVDAAGMPSIVGTAPTLASGGSTALAESPRRDRWVQILFPEPDELTVFIMGLTMLLVLIMSSVTLEWVWDFYGYVIAKKSWQSVLFFVTLSCAVAASLCLPFTRRTYPVLCLFVLLAHGALIILANCGQFFFRRYDEPSGVGLFAWASAFYATVWIYALLNGHEPEAIVYMEISERQAHAREALYAGAACVVLVLVAVKILEADPLKVYSFAALGAAGVHRAVRNTLMRTD